jgi:hypothetical protein
MLILLRKWGFIPHPPKAGGGIGGLSNTYRNKIKKKLKKIKKKLETKLKTKLEKNKKNLFFLYKTNFIYI